MGGSHWDAHLVEMCGQVIGAERLARAALGNKADAWLAAVFMWSRSVM